MPVNRHVTAIPATSYGASTVEKFEEFVTFAA